MQPPRNLLHARPSVRPKVEHILGRIVMHVPDFLNVVVQRRHRCLIFAQRRFRLLQSPGEIIAVILHRIIRILRSVKAAVRVVAEPFVHPANDVARHLREKFLPGRLISVHIVF